MPARHLGPWSAVDGVTLSAVAALTAAIEPLPSWLAVVLAGVVGLVVGSFLNVVVYRLPRRLSVVRPGSFCPRCGTPLRALDNVPLVSWLALRRRCRTCREPISARYPVVEALTGATFAVVAGVAGPHWAVPGLCALAATLLAAAVVELDGLAPPRSLTLWGSAVGSTLLAAAAVADRHWMALVGAGIGALVAIGVGLAASRGATRPSPAAWVLLPASVALGWSGLAGAASGIGALVVAIAIGKRVSGRHVPAMAAGCAAVVAVIAAAATGVPVGR